MSVTQETPVGSIVAERFDRANVFERLGIDYCCHGATPLGEACDQLSLDVGHVLAEIAASDRHEAREDHDHVDYSAMSASELADHIVASHHVYLRQELPRLSELLGKVVAAHSANHAELVDLRRTFAGLRQELELHLMKEEQVLFPLVKRLEGTREAFPIHCGTVENPIRVMEHEHESAGSALERIRELTGDYRAPADGCTSFQALYDGLSRLEADLHQHIHKENNILFPKAAALESTLMRTRA